MTRSTPLSSLVARLHPASAVCGDIKRNELRQLRIASAMSNTAILSKPASGLHDEEHDAARSLRPIVVGFCVSYVLLMVAGTVQITADLSARSQAALAVEVALAEPRQ